MLQFDISWNSTEKPLDSTFYTRKLKYFDCILQLDSLYGPVPGMFQLHIQYVLMESH